MTIKRRLAAFRAPAIGGHYLFYLFITANSLSGPNDGEEGGGAGEKGRSGEGVIMEEGMFFF